MFDFRADDAGGSQSFCHDAWGGSVMQEIESRIAVAYGMLTSVTWRVSGVILAGLSHEMSREGGDIIGVVGRSVVC